MRHVGLLPTYVSVQSRVALVLVVLYVWVNENSRGSLGCSNDHLKNIIYDI